MPYLNVTHPNQDVLNLHFVDTGFKDPTAPGATVVLIHGWPLSHRMWEPQLEALYQAGHRAIAYDRRGFGDSSKPWSGYDYDTLSDDLHALLEALDLEQVVLVGFSMGGGEVARYIARHGEQRISKLALLGAVTPYLLKDESNPEGVDGSVFEQMLDGVRKDRPAFLAPFGKAFLNWSEEQPSVSPEWLDYNRIIALFASPHGTLECIKAFSATDFRDDLKRIKLPTLVLHGDSDQTVPFEVSGKRVTEFVPHAQVELIEGGPHGFNLTHVEHTNRQLLDFIKA
ncbi:alpha/beta fold hydrolase [Halotalea alkalilenta]|uniref:alpha/beta fold hydrolase n=1 Tax=Halotalea alkalilenta TaxID=376489 RepID=UPI000481C902|nr:alpha/beta hydrolase [Halotalea alkalilenta]